MEKVYISGHPCIIGEVELTDNKFFSLAPGEMVKRIGDGTKTGCYTTLDFKTHLTYKGSVEIDGSVYYAFLLPENEVSGFNLFRPEQTVYLCFEECSGMVALFDSSANKLLLMLPKFE